MVREHGHSTQGKEKLGRSRDRDRDRETETERDRETARARERILIRIFIELGHLPVSMGKVVVGGEGGRYKYIHPGRHKCAFHTAVFDDLLNTKTRKRNHQNIPYMVSAWFLHVS